MVVPMGSLPVPMAAEDSMSSTTIQGTFELSIGGIIEFIAEIKNVLTYYD